MRRRGRRDYRKNKDDRDECDGNDDFCHPLGGTGPTVANPHSQCNWSDKTIKKKNKICF